MPPKQNSIKKDAELLKIIRGSVDQLMQQVKIADVNNPAKAKRLLKQINSIMDQFDLTVQQVMPKRLIESYFAGVDEAGEVLAAAAGNAPPVMALTKEGLISKPFQRLIHMNALTNLIDDTMMDMNAATRSVRANAAQSINTTLRNVKADIATGLVNGNTRKFTKEAVMKTFRDQGMTSFITKDGKKLPLNFYAETVVRTKTRTAQVQGTINRYRDAGLDLIQIIGNGDSCAKCSAHQGIVMSISGNTPGYPVAGSGGHMLPPFHPNCRCGVNLWDSQFKTDEEKAVATQRNAAFNPDEDRRTAAQKAFYDQEQNLRRIANAEQKQFIRWTDSLQAQAPANLGAFRRMKRQNTIEFQNLQSQFRSKAMTDSWARRKAGLPPIPPPVPPVIVPPVPAAVIPPAPVVPKPVPVAPPVAAPTISPAATVKETNWQDVDPWDYKLPDKAAMRKVGDQNYDDMNADDDYAYGKYVATGNSFTTNQFLYSGDYAKYKSGVLPMTDRAESRIEYIDDFSKLIQKSSLPVQMKTVRMVDSNFLESVMTTVGARPLPYSTLAPKAEYLRRVRGSLLGVRYTNKSFTSVSYDPNANYFTSRPIKMELLSEKGQKGLITKNHNESEIVFDKDTEFEFVDFDIDDKGFLNVAVRIIK